MNWPRVIIGLVIAAVGIQASSDGPYLWYGAILVGGWMVLTGFAGAFQAVGDKFESPERLAEVQAERLRQRTFEPMVPSIKARYTDEQWSEVLVDHSARAGRILPDWRVAELIYEEGRAAADAGAAAYMANAQAVYEPLVEELKKSTTAADWDWQRNRLIGAINEHRAGRGLPPVDDVEDWRVAWELHPIKLDDNGHPREALPKPMARPARARTKPSSATN